MNGTVVPPPEAAVIAPLRIQRIALTDFRAFPGPAPVAFELDGKNLLVYGENGAGKSSLFHALQDFFSLQPRRSLAEHKNVFSQLTSADCQVRVEFVDQPGKPADWIEKKHPAGFQAWLLARNIHPSGNNGDARVVDAARRSACLDYKSLLETNYRHGSEAINLFDLAVSSLLRDFRVTVEGGTESTISSLWSTIQRAERNALVGTRSTKKEQKVRDACVAFNTAFRSALDRLLPKANDVLQSLGWKDVVLSQLNCPGVTYQTAHFRSARKLDGLSLTPAITFRGKPLDRPQLFLNEARLSGLALALYLGGRLASVPTVDTQALKLLVLDDVLVGLDHSNRLPVLDLLASHFADWQVVLLTHDRAWFELTQSHVDEKGWNFVEVYEGDANAQTPCPIVRKAENRPAKNLLAKAKELLTTPYLEAAANYTRQGFELAIRGACEAKGIDMPYRVYPKGHKKPLESQAFLDKLKQWKASDQQKQASWNDALKKLETMKSVVMNPYSHPSAPNIPKQEIQQAIDAVETFLALAK